MFSCVKSDRTSAAASLLQERSVDLQLECEAADRFTEETRNFTDEDQKILNNTRRRIIKLTTRAHTHSVSE